MVDEDAGGLDMRAGAITGAARCAGYEVVDVVHDRDTSVPALERPGLSRALERIASGRADGLLMADVLRACGRSPISRRSCGGSPTPR